jgi:hypothetical protein
LAQCFPADGELIAYLPRHPPGTEPFSHFRKGCALDLTPYVKNARAEITASKSSKFQHQNGKDNPSRIIAIKPDGTEVNWIDWILAGGKIFKIADAIDDFDNDNVLQHRDGEKLEVICPFDENHSEQGGSGFSVKNPDGAVDENWAAGCRHNGCAHLNGDRLVFLNGLLERTPELWDALEKEEYYG